MGTYLNPGKYAFEEAFNSRIFVDKIEMIAYLNSVVCTEQKYVSVSRPRRFGKSMAANMVCAYYAHGAESRSLFEKCKISGIPRLENDLKWDEYLGHFDVIRIVITDFMDESDSVTEMLDYLSDEVISELKEKYPNVRYGNHVNIRTVMSKIFVSKKTQFVVVIDEWDAVFREYKDDKEGQKEYLEFLRNWLKNKEYIALVYMTGILPIKKYGKHSALNMFDEYSMTQPMQLAKYVGFTAEEVQELCEKWELRYDGLKSWYDGYRLSNKVSPELMKENATVDETVYRKYEVYSPFSVVRAIQSKQLKNYWNQSETYEALIQYIDWNFDGLKEDIAVLMEGGRVPVDITGYQNDVTTFNSKDDILTMLIHLGYLGYDSETEELFIPNKEVLDVFRSSTKNRDWSVTFRVLQNSQKLLEATWNCDKETVKVAV